MFEIDIAARNRTYDLPGGPRTEFIDHHAVGTIEPYCDEFGEPTVGGWIGYAIAFVLMLAFVGYGFFMFDPIFSG